MNKLNIIFIIFYACFSILFTVGLIIADTFPKVIFHGLGALWFAYRTNKLYFRIL